MGIGTKIADQTIISMMPKGLPFRRLSSDALLMMRLEQLQQNADRRFVKKAVFGTAVAPEGPAISPNPMAARPMPASCPPPILSPMNRADRIRVKMAWDCMTTEASPAGMPILSE